MSSRSQRENQSVGEPRRARNKISKKDQILALYLSGMSEIEDLSLITGSRPSYVGAILQEAGLEPGYFDLYTSTQHPMNVYSKFFANKLSFKNEEAAHKSIELIENLFRQFELARDRAGQHHALVMALTMFDRARWTGKTTEANIFRRWLVAQLDEVEISSPDALIEPTSEEPIDSPGTTE